MIIHKDVTTVGQLKRILDRVDDKTPLLVSIQGSVFSSPENVEFNMEDNYLAINGEAAEILCPKTLECVGMSNKMKPCCKKKT